MTHQHLASPGAERPTPVFAWIRRPLLRQRDNHGVRAIFGAMGRSHNPRFVFTTWLISRLLILTLWALSRFSLGDIRYYFMKMQLLGQSGPSQTMIEYPTPVLWYFQAIYALSFHQVAAFAALFVGCMIGLDVTLTWMLWKVGAGRRGEAVLFWTVFLFLVGPTAYLRFDLVTAALAGLALLALERRNSLRAGILTGLGAATKLWPALLWPALLGGSKKERMRITLGFAITGVVTAGGALVYAGWDRLLSPLNYQSARGLQIESFWAVPPMLARIFYRASYAVNVSIWNAWEITGPGTNAMLLAAKVAQPLGLLFVAICYVLWLRRGRQRFVEASALMLLVILVMILTNKTFSPQYVMWLGGPAAAGIAMLPHSHLPDDTRAERRRSDHEAVSRLRTIARVLLVCTALTTLVYPVGYDYLVHDRFGMSLVTVALATRNLLLAWLFYLVALWVVHFAWLGQRRRRREHSHKANRTTPGSATPDLDESAMADDLVEPGTVSS